MTKTLPLTLGMLTCFSRLSRYQRFPPMFSTRGGAAALPNRLERAPKPGQELPHMGKAQRCFINFTSLT